MGFFLVGIFSGSCESRNSSSRMYPLVQSVNSDIPAFGGLLVFSSLCKIGIIAPSCHVPWDHIPSRSYPLFKARAILEGILSTHGYKAKRT